MEPSENADLEDLEGKKKKKRFGPARWLFSIIFGIVGVYWGAGALAHFVIWPVFPPPDPVMAGDLIRSDYEGVTIEVERIEDGWVYGDMTYQAGAVGAPLHLHEETDMEWTVVSGSVQVEVEETERWINSGEGFLCGAGTPHRVYNKTGEDAVIRGKLFPEAYATCLAQLYGWFDESEENRAATRLILQMAMFDAYCDYRYKGAPSWAYLPAMTVLAPTARLAGYPPYHERFTLAARRVQRAEEEREAAEEEAREEEERRERRRGRRRR